ncbi:hypothetical protein L3X38_009624 [Prunus dulcis]|uniref:Uncharacterized protein n=1 Tax=Prunus dulcis TaxID=3755 RepID=A0AAD4WFL4_PRUDU|nr:hypothetical protein L3X38_009624 [Prunus dulcis]
MFQLEVSVRSHIDQTERGQCALYVHTRIYLARGLHIDQTERGQCALYVHTRIYLARGLLGAHWLRSCKNSEVKRVGGWSNPRMGDHPGKLLRELPETKPCGLHEAFWELTGFGVVRTPKLSEWEAGAIPGWVTTLGSCFVSSQKQNRAGW